MGVNFIYLFIYLKKSNVFEKFFFLRKKIFLRIYQLKNFEKIFEKVVILAVYFSRSTHTTIFRTYARKLVTS